MPRPAEELEGWMRPTELAWIKEQAVKCKAIVEIGSYRGRSTRAWVDHMPSDGVIYCVDPWLPSKDNYYSGESDFTAFKDNLDDQLEAGRVIPIRNTSSEAIKVLDHLVGQVDLVFIDGDHTGPAVAADIENYLPLVRPGGIISGHDYDKSHSGLRRAVDRKFGDRVRLTESRTQAIWWVQL